MSSTAINNGHPTDGFGVKPSPAPIHCAVIRTRHPDRKNAVAYWQVTVTRHAGLLVRFEACADLVAVRWQIGDTVGWETAPFQNHRPGRNRLALAIDQHLLKATFPQDVILVDRYVGLGSYLLSQLILAARAVCPECALREMLSRVDATDDDSRDSRNYFYEKLGFTLEFPKDPERREGFVVCQRLTDLNPGWGSERNPVDEIEGAALLRDLADWERRARDLEQRLAAESRRLTAELGRARRAAARWRRAFIVLIVAATVGLYLALQ
ncbi:MAG TPA: hypothetical protein ENI94_06650 [Gammaproteobacteria bacterium]|nr:hypothetical protein [Gammaproteobacteria bacterium]